MIKGIGVDIVELKRIEKHLSKTNRLMKRILTKDEEKRYQELSSKRRKLEYLAGRFAAKEACAKAFGTGIGKELSFQDIMIYKDEFGAPYMTVKGAGHIHIFVSISHSTEYAIAQVVIEEI